jgi:hypothetical protein
LRSAVSTVFLQNPFMMFTFVNPELTPESILCMTYALEAIINFSFSGIGVDHALPVLGILPSLTALSSGILTNWAWIIFAAGSKAHQRSPPLASAFSSFTAIQRMNCLQPAQCRLDCPGFLPAPMRVEVLPQWGQGYLSESLNVRELLSECLNVIMAANPKICWNPLAISALLGFSRVWLCESTLH